MKARIEAGGIETVTRIGLRCREIDDDRRLADEPRRRNLPKRRTELEPGLKGSRIKISPR